MKMETENKGTFISDRMCRLCLGQCDIENAVEIFHTNDLSIRIMACTGLEVCSLFSKIYVRILATPHFGIVCIAIILTYR